MESRVILSAVLKLKTLAVVALPIHGCLLVRWDQAESAKEVMEVAFEQVTGGKGQAEIDFSPLALSLVSQTTVSPKYT